MKQFFYRPGLRFFTLLCSVFLTLGASYSSHAQVTPSIGYTALQLATKLAGPGVSISSPSLTCATGGSGEFQVTSSNLGIDCGVVLTNGQVVTGGGVVGINIPNGVPASTIQASNSLGGPGDADLATLSSFPTHDACVLEFDFTPIGSSISFNYVFGSEEYTSYTCTIYNDVFGFFISGGGYATPTNIALVPGTSIPVAVNSVNCGPTGSGSLPTCTAMGPGSPFCTYYVNNSAGTTIIYDGFTTVLTATATVAPCVAHHLKLGIADASDDALDSGVFLKAGSLTSVLPTGVTAIGYETTQALLRPCTPGKFRFSTTPHCLPTVINYQVTGTATNGVDYTLSPGGGTVTIPAFASFADVDVTTLPLPPTFPKTVVVTLLHPDHCNPDLLLPTVPTPPSETATLTIYDTLQLKIVTPDDTICSGESLPLLVTSDPVFGPWMVYSWDPTAGVSDPTALSPTMSPTTTTLYEITTGLPSPPTTGCPETKKKIKITVFDKPTLTTDSALVKTCVGTPVDLHVRAMPDTVDYTYSWTPATALSTSTQWNPTVNPTVPGDVTYTITVAPSALLTCKSTDTIRVHTLGDFTLNNDTVICVGQWIQGSANGDTEFTWRWRPHDFVADTTIRHTVITPTVTTTYTVSASYAHCPDYVHSFTVEVNYPPAAVTFTDTICLGMSKSYDVTVPATGLYYHYQWTPPDFLNNDTIPNPVITPTVTGQFHYAVGIQQRTAACLITDLVDLYVLPNTIDIVTPDTAICKGRPVQILASGHPLFAYQWRPTAGIAFSDVIAPLITPDTSAEYVVSFSFHTCPTYYDSVFIDVQPIPVVYAGGNRFVCEYDSLQLHAGVTPNWYTHYNYSWTPASLIDHPNDPNPLLYAMDSANIILTVTTPAGCKGVDSAFVNVLPGDFASMVSSMDFCPHDTAVLMPAGGISYQWKPGLYIDDSIAARPVIRPITTQMYSVIATSSDGCRDTLLFTATVHPAAVIFLEDSVRLHPGETYQLDPRSNATRFLWSPPAGLSSRYISNPVADPSVSTKYIVTASTENGCETRDSINIIVDPGTLLDLPNAFAPGNGANGTFKIIKRGVAKLNYFRIYNRWGNLVFETTDIDKGWDGTFNGQPQPVGVFVYDVQAVSSDGKVFAKQGNMTLLR